MNPDLIQKISQMAKDFIQRVPVFLITVGVAGYLAYDYFIVFKQSPESPLQIKKQEIEVTHTQNSKLEEKVRQAQEFFKTLEAKREEIRKLAIELGEMRSTLSEELDIPAFIKMVVIEAKKAGLKVNSIRPTKENKKELFVEQIFELAFRGLYAQLVVFLDRLADVKKIVRVEEFDIRPAGNQATRFVELVGTFQVKTFRYSGSKADEVAKSNSAAAAAGAAAAGGATGGVAPSVRGEP